LSGDGSRQASLQKKRGGAGEFVRGGRKGRFCLCQKKKAGGHRGYNVRPLGELKTRGEEGLKKKKNLQREEERQIKEKKKRRKRERDLAPSTSSYHVARSRRKRREKDLAKEEKGVRILKRK